MPVAVVALAAGSFAAGATAFAAAATVASTIAAGAMMVGSALTIVGTVTGNAKLAKIGAVIGIAGGIGNMLTAGAEAGATAASTAGEGAAGAGAAGDAAAGGAQTFSVAAPGAVESLPGTVSGSGMLDAGAVANTASAGAPVLENAAAAAPPSGMLGSVPGNVTDPLAQAQGSATSAYDAANTAAGQSAASSGMVDSAFDPNVKIPINNAALQALPAITSGPAAPGVLSQVSLWAKQNPELARMAISAGGAAVGNLVPSEKDKAMMEAYAAQTDALKRKAAWGAGRTTY